MEDKKTEQEKLSFGRTISNDWYAMKLAGKYSKKFVLGALLMTIFGYLEWVFFDAIFVRRIVDGLSRNESFREIFLFIGISGVVFAVARCISNYLENVTFPLEMTKLYGKIYAKLYKKAANVELKCYEDADFYNRYTMACDQAVDKIWEIVLSFFGIFVGAASAVAVFKFMFDIDPYSVLFILAPLIGNFLFGNLKNKAEYKRYKEQAPNDKVLNYVNRTMYLPDYAKELRLFKVFNLLRGQYRKATKNNVDVASKYAFRNAHLNFWRITFTFSIIFEGMMVYGIYLFAVKHSITLAELTVMTSMMVAMTWILIDLFEDIMVVMKDGLFVNNLRGFIEYEEKIPEDQDGLAVEEFTSLEFDHVCFSYKSEETINDLSFTVRKGEKVALVGHNGAGKTTIIKLLLRLYDPTSGVIRVNGIDIRSYNLRQYRELFATTFQDFAIFGMTVRDNVLMGRSFTEVTGEDGAVTDKSDEVARTALEKAGAWEIVQELPNGLDTIMTKEFDKDGAILSGGQSQKLAVSRTFAQPAPVKIFDEPSSALDPIAEYDLFQNIMKEADGHTLIFISHRLSSVKNCDEVFMLAEGTLIERGSHKELVNRDGEYARMYKKQAMNYLAIDNESEVAI